MSTQSSILPYGVRRYSLPFLLALALAAKVAVAAAAPTGHPLSPSVMAPLQRNMTQLGLRRCANAWTSTAYCGEAVRMAFQDDSRRILFNDTCVWMHGAAIVRRRSWYVPEADLWWVLAPLANPRGVLRAASLAPVVLDPGHGGADPGARGASGLTEKDVTLDLAQRVLALLRASGIDVVTTRTGDQTISLGERSLLARNVRAAVFVSIHLNSSANPKSSGIETYVLAAPGCGSTANDGATEGPLPGNAFDAPSMVLAYATHKAVRLSTGMEDRGIRHARFAVLKNAPCPSALIEAGFVSQSAQERNTRDAAYRDRIAGGLATGILNYLRLVQETQAK